MRSEYRVLPIVREGVSRYASSSTRGIVVETLGLEDQIYVLIERAIDTSDPDELEKVMAELRVALKEHIQQARTAAASSWPPVSPRRR